MLKKCRKKKNLEKKKEANVENTGKKEIQKKGRNAEK